MNLFAAVLASVLLVAIAPAQAQKLDLSKMTCKQFTESSKDDVALIVTWLSGFFTDEDDPPIVDADKMKTDAQKLSDYCAKNPTAELMDAAEEVWDK